MCKYVRTNVKAVGCLYGEGLTKGKDIILESVFDKFPLTEIETTSATTLTDEFWIEVEIGIEEEIGIEVEIEGEGSCTEVGLLLDPHPILKNVLEEPS